MLDVSFATSGTSTGRVIAYLQYAWCDSFAASGSCTKYKPTICRVLPRYLVQVFYSLARDTVSREITYEKIPRKSHLWRCFCSVHGKRVAKNSSVVQCSLLLIRITGTWTCTCYFSKTWKITEIRRSEIRWLYFFHVFSTGGVLAPGCIAFALWHNTSIFVPVTAPYLYWNKPKLFIHTQKGI